MLRRTIFLLITLSCLSGTTTSYAWGGRDHIRINRKACYIVPDEMAEWRAYSDVVGFHGLDPDLWKSDDPAEGDRHYIDLEEYGSAETLSRERPDPVIPGIGLAPWVIMDLMDQLSQTMADGDWVMATRMAAALGHYVGDTHQPLHTTVNYDGQNTGHDGIHLRWEIYMPRRMKQNLSMQAIGPVRYLEDPWIDMMAWISNANSRYKAILEAEEVARSATHGDLESDLYFETLWECSGELFNEQTALSASDLASVWYTAWVNAGRPAIPPPPEKIVNTSFHATTQSEGTAQPSFWIFLACLGVLGAAIVGVSVKKQMALTKPKAKSESPKSSSPDGKNLE